MNMKMERGSPNRESRVFCSTNFIARAWDDSLVLKSCPGATKGIPLRNIQIWTA